MFTLCTPSRALAHLPVRSVSKTLPTPLPIPPPTPLSVSLDYFLFCQSCITKEAVKAHHLLASQCLSCAAPLAPLAIRRVCEACRSTAQHQRAASGLRWNAKHWVNPAFMLPVSFDKVLSELTYGNLVMMCLHTVISSAFHPYFLGLTIVPIMSAIVNVLHSLSCSTNRHVVVLFAWVA